MSTILVKLQHQATKRLAEVEPTIDSLRRTVAAYYGAAAGAGALSYALKAGDADVLALAPAPALVADPAPAFLKLRLLEELQQVEFRQIETTFFYLSFLHEIIDLLLNQFLLLSFRFLVEESEYKTSNKKRGEHLILPI